MKPRWSCLAFGLLVAAWLAAGCRESATRPPRRLGAVVTPTYLVPDRNLSDVQSRSASLANLGGVSSATVSGSLSSYFLSAGTPAFATTATLANYPTTASVSGSLASYFPSSGTTALATTASLSNYFLSSGTPAFATTATLANYPTTASVSGSLSSYFLSAGTTAFATTGSLAAYEPISAMAAYATTATLANYPTTASVSGSLASYFPSSGTTALATTASLSNYFLSSGTPAFATTATLANYPTTASVSGSLGSYPTTASVSGSLGNYLTTAAASSTYAPAGQVIVTHAGGTQTPYVSAGTTDAARGAALTAAFAAATTGEAIAIGPGSYSISSSLCIQQGQTVMLNGATIYNTANANDVFSAPGSQFTGTPNWRLCGNGQVIGSSSAAATTISGTATGAAVAAASWSPTSQCGLRVGGLEGNFTVEGISFANFGGCGICLSCSNGAAVGFPIVRGVTVTNCTFGISLPSGVSEGAEYTSISSCVLFANTINLYVACGNLETTGSVISSAGLWGVYLDSGSNDGHGLLSGCEINHNNLLQANGGGGIYDGVGDNGFTISGCHLFYSPITLYSAGGLRIIGCIIGNTTSPSVVPAVTFLGGYPDNGGYNTIENCWWFTSEPTFSDQAYPVGLPYLTLRNNRTGASNTSTSNTVQPAASFTSVTETSPTLLRLNQAAPQTVSGGMPTFSGGLIGSLYDAGGFSSPQYPADDNASTGVVAVQSSTSVISTGGGNDYSPAPYMVWPDSNLNINQTAITSGTAGWMAPWGNASNQCVHIALPAPAVITSFTYENGNNQNGGNNVWGVNGYVLMGSNTLGTSAASGFKDVSFASSADSAWTTLSSGSLQQNTATTGSNLQSISLSNTAAYQYYRLKCINNFGDNNGLCIRRFTLNTSTLPALSHDSSNRILYASGGTAAAINYASAGTVAIAGAIAQTSAPATINGTSGSLTWIEPDQGAADKRLNVYLNAFQGSATITFPTAFSAAPYLDGSSAATAVATATSSTLTISSTASAASGWIFLRGN